MTALEFLARLTEVAGPISPGGDRMVQAEELARSLPCPMSSLWLAWSDAKRRTWSSWRTVKAAIAAQSPEQLETAVAAHTAERREEIILLDVICYLKGPLMGPADASALWEWLGLIDEGEPIHGLLEYLWDTERDRYPEAYTRLDALSQCVEAQEEAARTYNRDLNRSDNPFGSFQTMVFADADAEIQFLNWWLIALLEKDRA